MRNLLITILLRVLRLAGDIGVTAVVVAHPPHASWITSRPTTVYDTSPFTRTTGVLLNPYEGSRSPPVDEDSGQAAGFSEECEKTGLVALWIL